MQSQAKAVTSKTYKCKECKASMVKRGAGLGKWYCTKNTAHNHRTKQQERFLGGTGKDLFSTRTVHQHYGIAVLSR